MEESEIVKLLREWQQARKAILEYKMKPNPDAEQMALWHRLANAEIALMKV